MVVPNNSSCPLGWLRVGLRVRADLAWVQLVNSSTFAESFQKIEASHQQTLLLGEDAVAGLRLVLVELGSVLGWLDSAGERLSSLCKVRL